MELPSGWSVGHVGCRRISRLVRLSERPNMMDYLIFIFFPQHWRFVFCSVEFPQLLHSAFLGIKTVCARSVSVSTRYTSVCCVAKECCVVSIRVAGTGLSLRPVKELHHTFSVCPLSIWPVEGDLNFLFGQVAEFCGLFSNQLSDI